MNLNEIADEISRRLISVFQQDSQGRRAVFGGNEKFQSDPHWRDYVPFSGATRNSNLRPTGDYVPFHEYFHGDNGSGVGASHQTGWTALVAKMIDEVSLKQKSSSRITATSNAT